MENEAIVKAVSKVLHIGEAFTEPLVKEVLEELASEGYLMALKEKL